MRNLLIAAVAVFGFAGCSVIEAVDEVIPAREVNAPTVEGDCVPTPVNAGQCPTPVDPLPCEPNQVNGGQCPDVPPCEWSPVLNDWVCVTP